MSKVVRVRITDSDGDQGGIETSDSTPELMFLVTATNNGVSACQVEDPGDARRMAAELLNWADRRDGAG